MYGAAEEADRSGGPAAGEGGAAGAVAAAAQVPAPPLAALAAPHVCVTRRRQRRHALAGHLLRQPALDEPCPRWHDAGLLPNYPSAT